MTNKQTTFALYAPCCHTEFVGATQEKVIEMHRDYHNLQFSKGRREAKI